MNNFECHICFRLFKTKQQLQRHEQAKNKCDLVTEFQCNKCLKYFKSKQNLEWLSRLSRKEPNLFKNYPEQKQSYDTSKPSRDNLWDLQQQDKLWSEM